jgi:hypothetical protein
MHGGLTLAKVIRTNTDLGEPVDVSTGQFTALNDEVADLEAEVARLRGVISVFEGNHHAIHAWSETIREMGRQEGREEILGRRVARASRPRHLRPVQ